MSDTTLILIGAMVVLFSANASALEKPEYQVLYEDGRIEYRLYAPYIVAETAVEMERSYNRASNEGFRRLLGYITGDNVSSAKIDMTAPVQMSMEFKSEEIAMTAPVQAKENTDGLQIAFMLPSRFSLIDAPVPTDERVSLREIPGRLMAVIRYSGRWTDRNRQRYEMELRESVETAGIEILSSAESAAYNPPFTPPFLRRNEIMVEVADYPKAET